jgi:hypothetical protein
MKSLEKKLNSIRDEKTHLIRKRDKIQKTLNNLTRKDEQLRKQRKKVVNINDCEFGHHDDICYRASHILIDGELYFGFIKCWKLKKQNRYKYGRTRLFMPIKSWEFFVRYVLPTLRNPATYQRQLAIDEQETYATCSIFRDDVIQNMWD